MPFKKGQSGNPTGRPKGSSGKLTRYAQAFLNEHQEHIVRDGWEKAKNGDSQLHKVFLERVLPPAPKEIKVGLEIEEMTLPEGHVGLSEFNQELMGLSLATWDTEKFERFIDVMNMFLEHSKMTEDELREKIKRIDLEGFEADRQKRTARLTPD